MRRFLLWVGSMLVGCFTLVATLGILGGGGSAVVGLLLVWLVVLFVGVVLSAPAYLRPSEFRGGWSVRVPLPLWLALTVIRLISGLGFWILYLVWLVLGQLIERVKSA